MDMFTLFSREIVNVIVIGLIAGAGLPAIFSLGMASFAYGAGGDAETNPQPGHPIGRVLGVLCFGIVLVTITLGITVIVASGFGYHLSFEHIFPTFEPKG